MAKTGSKPKRCVDCCGICVEWWPPAKLPGARLRKDALGVCSVYRTIGNEQRQMRTMYHDKCPDFLDYRDGKFSERF